ncbi:putative karyogamy-related protein [Naematelia encephala]|uniref:Putative karyogamy-related protein n=1 Tax=Naematelia encephala TaxID=71784 RepID=A0A1Y2B589_9TREE|nr:putative karyogamy-related protein [Naematelia encephala]
MSDVEWALLRGLPQPLPSETGPTEVIVDKLLQADYRGVLLSSQATAVFNQPGLFDGLVPPSSSEPTTQSNPLAQLIIAIALQHAFVQANWTGPDLTISINDLLPSNYPTLTTDELNSASLPYLALGGEPAYHLCAHPALFLLSIRLLTNLNLPTIPWWKLRSHLVHQALLDEPVELPSNTFEEVRRLFDILPDDQDLRASLHLEIGLYYHSLAQDKLANQEFLEAARCSGLEFELTGALGKRTKFQIEAHSQLILLAESRKREGEEISESGAAEQSNVAVPESLALNDDTLLEETEFTKLTTSPASTSSTSRLSHLDPTSQPPLHPLDQSLLLSLCLSQHNNSPSSGLTANQMMPFLSRVLSHPRNWSVHTTALLLRSRLEATRSRTVERSTLQLAALIEQMPTSDSSVQERLRYFHQLPLPSKWEAERELAKRYMSLGVVRSALEIFTRLEMWEDAVGCLQRMEKDVEAERIVRDLLEGRKIESDLVQSRGKETMSEGRRMRLESGREGKLRCLLGDLTLSSDAASKDPKAAREAAIGHYEAAWEVSKHTSSRAMRSLGTLRVAGHEYELAIPCFQAALAINPLYARSWFTLGVCFVRLARWSEARDAFRRQVAVDEEDGEGWNNLAAVYLRLHEETSSSDESEGSKSASFDDKLLAFRALRQGLRVAHNNWRMWENYMIIALDVGELAESARAMTRVIEERGEVGIDVDVLDRLVDSVTRDDYDSNMNGQLVTPKSNNEGFGLLPNVERLFDKVILPRVSSNARVWQSHSRLLRWKQDWSGAIEDYLRAYRCGPASEQGVERDIEKWKEAVVEIQDLVDVLSLLGPKAAAESDAASGTKKKGDWRFQARGIVRTFIGRTRES